MRPLLNLGRHSRVALRGLRDRGTGSRGSSRRPRKAPTRLKFRPINHVLQGAHQVPPSAPSFWNACGSRKEVTACTCTQARQQQWQQQRSRGVVTDTAKRVRETTLMTNGGAGEGNDGDDGEGVGDDDGDPNDVKNNDGHNGNGDDIDDDGDDGGVDDDVATTAT